MGNKEPTIQFIGVSKMETEDQLLVKELAEEYYPKIQRELNNMVSLVVHVKEYSKEGSKIKYALHTRALAPTRIFESCKSHDFDLSRALHKSFKDLLTQIQHAFHGDVDACSGKSRSSATKKRSRADQDVRGF